MLCYTCSAFAKKTEIHIGDEEIKVIYNREVGFKFINDLIYDKIIVDDRINAFNSKLKGVIKKEENSMFSIRFYDKNENMIASFIDKK